MKSTKLIKQHLIIEKFNNIFQELEWDGTPLIFSTEHGFKVKRYLMELKRYYFKTENGNEVYRGKFLKFNNNKESNYAKKRTTK